MGHSHGENDRKIGADDGGLGRVLGPENEDAGGHAAIDGASDTVQDAEPRGDARDEVDDVGRGLALGFQEASSRSPRKREAAKGPDIDHQRHDHGRLATHTHGLRLDGNLSQDGTVRRFKGILMSVGSDRELCLDPCAPRQFGQISKSRVIDGSSGKVVWMAHKILEAGVGETADPEEKSP